MLDPLTICHQVGPNEKISTDLFILSLCPYSSLREMETFDLVMMRLVEVSAGRRTRQPAERSYARNPAEEADNVQRYMR